MNENFLKRLFSKPARISGALMNNGRQKTSRARTLFLQAGGGLSFVRPTAKDKSFDEYISDPARPVPFINGVAIGMTREYMTEDQRFASRRPDVLVYQTEPLTENLTVAGPITATLYVSTSGTDSDFIVKLIDVLPNDTPDNRANRGRRKTGWISNVGAWRADARAVQKQLLQAGTNVAKQSHESGVYAAGREPFVSEGPPHHGPNSEQLVSVGGSQSTEVRGYQSSN